MLYFYGLTGSSRCSKLELLPQGELLQRKTRRQADLPFFSFSLLRVTLNRFTGMSTLVRDYLALDDFLWSPPEVLNEPIPCSPWSSGELELSSFFISPPPPPELPFLVYRSKDEGDWIFLVQERFCSSSRLQGGSSTVGDLRRRGQSTRLSSSTLKGLPSPPLPSSTQP